jgi:hypothetical protein
MADICRSCLLFFEYEDERQRVHVCMPLAQHAPGDGIGAFAFALSPFASRALTPDT